MALGSFSFSDSVFCVQRNWESLVGMVGTVWYQMLVCMLVMGLPENDLREQGLGSAFIKLLCATTPR